jgi:catechol 2,3-dioxygenase-like lactoylglutathione lyase family enzyme
MSLISGVQEVVASVSDLRRVARVFTEVAGYTAKRLPDAPREQWKAWRVPRGCKRIEQLLLVPANDTRGCVRLVKFQGVAQEVMRSSGRTWDTGGIFDIDVFTRDARGLYRKLQAHGWTAYSDPTHYEWGGFEVWEVVAIGPDGLVIAAIQPLNHPIRGFPRFRGFTRVFNSAQVVRDYEATKRFFVDGLGWKYFIDTDFRDSVEPGPMLGVPMPLARTMRRRIGIVHPEGTNDGSLEPISLPELAGRDLAERCVAPNLGWLAYRFPVTDAREYARQLEARGIELYTQPMALHIAPYGEVTQFAVRTPDGAIIELFQART